MHQRAIALFLAGAATLALAACGGNSNNNMPTATAGSFKSTILVSDGSVAAPHVAPNLQNSWGIAFGPTTPVWVSDNNTQKSSLYDGNPTGYINM